MSIAASPNHYKFQLMSAKINLASDTLKAILMDTDFEFDVDSHALLSDVIANQLATGNGYTRGSHSFTTPVLTEDDANNKGAFTCDDLTITASGGDIGPVGGYMIIDTSAIEATEFFTTLVDRTFVTISTHWVVGTVGTTFDATTDLSLVSDATGQYCAIPFSDIGTALKDGGLYRLQYDYSETTAGWEFKLNGVALQVLGDAVAGAAQIIDFIAAEDFATTDELRIYSKTNAAAAGDFDNFSLKELGTIVANVDFNSLFDSITDGSTAGASVFTSAGSSWDVDGLIGKKVVISTGSDIGYYLITDNDATTITVAETFTGTESDLVATIQTLVDYTISSGSSIQLQNVAISVA